jgi:hypothetical protein
VKLDLDRLRAWGIGAFALLSVGVVLAFLTKDWWDHRIAPWPKGAVLRVELPKALLSFGPAFHVAQIERDGPALAIYREGGDPGTSLAHEPAILCVFAWPSGELLERVERPWSEQLAGFELARTSSAATGFDFDGDGTTDSSHWAVGGRAWIASGASGAPSWEHTDPLEYEDPERLVPLGDLDGDGCSELAVLHPRRDRSEYDWELFDLIFGAKSWLTVVSGAKATRR